MAHSGLETMRLRRAFHDTEANAAINFIQISHRRDAVAYAFAGIARQHDAVLEAFGRDPFMTDMESTMRAWVAETLIQGAFLREYHLWEKDCKAYFPVMAQRNSKSLTMRPVKGQTFTDLICETLAQFDIVMPNSITGAIDKMRERVNIMKHEAGLELEHFVSEADYYASVSALEGFWSHLADAEEVRP
jgi:hypothetical protein